jgi:ABC-type cobalamin/Fe3+-siderophores transport system ATPase subunit
MAYIQRTIEETLKKAAMEFPVVVLIGPRQSGKTTVLQHLFSAAAGHVSLEAPDIMLPISCPTSRSRSTRTGH